MFKNQITQIDIINLYLVIFLIFLLYSGLYFFGRKIRFNLKIFLLSIVVAFLLTLSSFVVVSTKYSGALFYNQVRGYPISYFESMEDLELDAQSLSREDSESYSFKLERFLSNSLLYFFIIYITVYYSNLALDRFHKIDL